MVLRKVSIGKLVNDHVLWVYLCMEKAYKYHPVAIEWRDSASIQQGWMPTTMTEELGVSECLSVGFVVSEDKDRVVICSNISNTNQSSPMVNGGMVILKKQIVKIHKL